MNGQCPERDTGLGIPEAGKLPHFILLQSSTNNIIYTVLVIS